ncbi:CinA family protein [Kiloniella sp. EL199]|uniref:CinA family protein n=1 Tax=Kiloniella sp. EL199 TaxID=2107581 RepID=UPI000EA05CBC|nr:nicotinamide-nucleotide amidohydrolase family protein [Kiloniella sp. EL199]
MSLTVEINTLATEVLELCRTKDLQIATAESCTGGLIAGALTEIAGSSDVVDRGFVTYSNEAKHEMLGVRIEQISMHGAVSSPVASSMAEGAMKFSNAQLTVSVTGIAGPGGGTSQKPVGTVYIGTALENDRTLYQSYRFDGDRASIRQQTVHAALSFLKNRLL